MFRRNLWFLRGFGAWNRSLIRGSWKGTLSSHNGDLNPSVSPYMFSRYIIAANDFNEWTTAEFAPDITRTTHAILAAGDSGGCVAVYDVDRWDQQLDLCPRIAHFYVPSPDTEPPSPIVRLAWAAGASLLLVATAHSCIYTIDTSDPHSDVRLGFRLPGGEKTEICGLSARPGADSEILVGEKSGRILLWWSGTEKYEELLTGAHCRPQAGPEGVGPDFGVSYGRTDTQAVCDHLSGGPGERMTDIRWVDNDLFATCGTDGSVRLWSLRRVYEMRDSAPGGAASQWAAANSFVAAWYSPAEKPPSLAMPRVSKWRYAFISLAASSLSHSIVALNSSDSQHFIDYSPALLALADEGTARLPLFFETSLLVSGRFRDERVRCAFTSDGAHVVCGSTTSVPSLWTVPHSIMARSLEKDSCGPLLHSPRVFDPQNGTWSSSIKPQLTYSKPHYQLPVPIEGPAPIVATHPSRPSLFATGGGRGLLLWDMIPTSLDRGADYLVQSLAPMDEQQDVLSPGEPLTVQFADIDTHSPVRDMDITSSVNLESAALAPPPLDSTLSFSGFHPLDSDITIDFASISHTAGRTPQSAQQAGQPRDPSLPPPSFRFPTEFNTIRAQMQEFTPRSELSSPHYRTPRPDDSLSIPLPISQHVPDFSIESPLSISGCSPLHARGITLGQYPSVLTPLSEDLDIGGATTPPTGFSQIARPFEQKICGLCSGIGPFLE